MHGKLCTLTHTQILVSSHTRDGERNTRIYYIAGATTVDAEVLQQSVIVQRV